MDIVTVQHLYKTFGKGESAVHALNGIDLAIEKGKFTAVIGASGSGKTTLLNIIGGLDTPDEGEVIVDGIRLSGLKEKELAVFRRSKVGFVYQSFNLVPTLTVRENILFPLSLAGSGPEPDFYSEMIELLHLKDRQNAAGAFRRRSAAGGDCAGTDCEARPSSGGRAYRKSGLPKRAKCAGSVETVSGNLSSDISYEHAQS